MIQGDATDAVPRPIVVLCRIQTANPHSQRWPISTSYSAMHTAISYVTTYFIVVEFQTTKQSLAWIGVLETSDINTAPIIQRTLKIRMQHLRSQVYTDAQRKPQNTLYNDQQWFGGNATADNSAGLSASLGHKTSVKYFVWE